MMNNRGFNNEYLETYLMCKEFNTLPFEGGWLDQPANFAQAFKIIRSVIHEYEVNNQKGGR